MRQMAIIFSGGVVIALAIVMVCTGCVGQAGNTLNGTEWVLASYSGDGAMVPVLNGTTISLLFTPGEATGTAGCNHYFASYRSSGDSISFENIGSTEMYCMAPGVMEQESRYLQIIGSAERYRLEADRLTFTDRNGTPLLVFDRYTPPPPRPLQNTAWNLISFHSGDAVSSTIAGTQITAVFGTDGRVAGTAGCNQYSAEYTVQGSTLEIGSPISTKMHCTAPAGLMQQETTYLNTLTSVKQFAIEGNVLVLLDGGGRPLLTFSAN
jgi:heat shock protein HslJ